MLNREGGGLQDQSTTSRLKGVRKTQSNHATASTHSDVGHTAAAYIEEKQRVLAQVSQAAVTQNVASLRLKTGLMNVYALPADLACRYPAASGMQRRSCSTHLVTRSASHCFIRKRTVTVNIQIVYSAEEAIQAENTPGRMTNAKNRALHLNVLGDAKEVGQPFRRFNRKHLMEIKNLFENTIVIICKMTGEQLPPIKRY